MGVYSPSSSQSTAVNMNVWYQHVLCPNTVKKHWNGRRKEVVKIVGRMVKLRCLECGQTFWIEEFKRPMSRRSRR